MATPLKCIKCGRVTKARDAVKIDAERCICPSCVETAAKGAGGGRPRRKRRLFLAVLGLIVLAAAASLYVYRRMNKDAEFKARVERERDELVEKLMGVKERLPEDREELKELAEKGIEELRERGIDPDKLKEKLEEIERKLRGE